MPEVHMLRSTGVEKGSTAPTIKARCGLERPRRSTQEFPEDFTGWERDVTCPTCRLGTMDPATAKATNATLLLMVVVTVVVVVRLAADAL